jgi:hypothetical protein
MQIREIWPFLLPGVLLQLLMQILCIAEGVREDNRKPFHRTLYVLSIAIFGLAAIAFHLLRAEKTPPKDTTTAEVERANHLTNKGIFFLLLIAYQVMGLHMLAENLVPSSILRKLICSLGKTELSSDEIRLVRADCI